MSRAAKAGAPGSGRPAPAEARARLGAAAISKRVSAALDILSAAP